MFTNVLVGVDGSDNGRDAIALAQRMTPPGGQLTLANVQCGEFPGFATISESLLDSQREEAEKLLATERDAAGVDAQIAAVFAPTPGRGLHEYAEDHGTDLIVVGSCHRGLIGRVMLGDDTAEALNGAPCAVAIAARGYAAAPVELKRIGVGYDGSPESKAALAAAKDIAEHSGGELSALQVIGIPTFTYTGVIPALTGESVDVLLEEATGRLKDMPDVAARAVYGVPGEELSAFSDELDLLVVGSRNFGPLRRRIVGSTTNYLERHTRCSLLNLPRSALKTQESRPPGVSVAA